MGFRRSILPARVSVGDELVADMVGIGMMLPGEPNWEANIEDTLLFASKRGVEGDPRLLALLVSWLEVHFPYLNADRLIRLVSEERSAGVRGFWGAFGLKHKKDRRFLRLSKFRGKWPADLEDRSAEVLEPEALAAMHDVYRCRVRMGPSYRADMWAVLEAQPGLSVSELARRTYGSFATAWQVKRDWRIFSHQERRES